LEVQEGESGEGAQGRGVFVLRGRTELVSGLKGVDGGEQKKERVRKGKRGNKEGRKERGKGERARE
jgi:hypothetical protein